MARRVHFDTFLDRDVNAGFSGGEIKRSELLQLMAQQPSLLLFDEPFQRMAGKRRQRTADAPYLRVVFPGVHQFDISRFEGAKPCCPAFEVHQMPMILLRMSIATPHAFAFSVIFDTRNLVSLYTRLSEYLLVADLRGSMM